VLLSGRFVLGHFVLVPRSWSSRPLRRRHLLVLVAGCGASCLRVFQGEGLYGEGGGGKVLRIYSLSERDGPLPPPSVQGY
jgi:hypothetical protein